MSPEQSSPHRPEMKRSTYDMDYIQIAGVAINYDTPENLHVLEQELLRRSADPAVKADPLYQKTWDLVQTRIQSHLQNS